MQYDTLIIGAGAAGLLAARELSAGGKTVAVVEALNRTGGRMHTVPDAATGALVELGAEFIHGDLPLTKKLLQEAGATLHPTNGSIWQHQAGSLQPQGEDAAWDGLIVKKCTEIKTDLPVADFLQQHFGSLQFEPLRAYLQDYVEGYYAADTARASTKALCADLAAEAVPEYRIEGGYAVLAAYLEAQCRSLGVDFFLAHTVREIQWQQGSAKVITDKGAFEGRKVVVTVSLGVLQSGAIRFVPSLPQHMAAAQALGYGHAVKINLLFKQAFWKDPRLTGGKALADLRFLFSEKKIPTWWSQHPMETNLLTGWLGGPDAKSLETATHEALLQLALDALSVIFGLEPAYLWQDLLGAWSHNWSADPYFRGAYSYDVVDGPAHQQVLQQPVANTIYFAGEALYHGFELGTVEAALCSGKEVAERISPERRESQ